MRNDRSSTRGMLAIALALLVLLGTAMAPGAASSAESDGSRHGAVRVAGATSIEELVASDDYTFGDADTLRLYRAFLNRDPDLDGAKYWIEIARNGANPDDLAYGFGQSAEFRARYGTLDNDAFLTVLYDNMLGREPDAEGFDYWLGEMNAGVLDQNSVVRWIVANEEFINRYPFLPPGSDGRPWFPRIEATVAGDLAGVPLDLRDIDAEQRLIRALGEPTDRLAWTQGCPLGGLEYVRSISWGQLTAWFLQYPGEVAFFERWTFSTSGLTVDDGGPGTVHLAGGFEVGDPLQAIAASRTDSVEYLDVFELYLLPEAPMVSSSGASAAAPSDSVDVPYIAFCD